MSTEPEYDLADEASVLSYLSSTPFACTSVTALSGGSANYVYRLHLAEEYKGRRALVLKHAKPYARTAKDFALHVTRQIYEGKSLERIKPLLPVTSLVTVPEVYYHDTRPGIYALIMDDCGVSGDNLKQIFIDDANKPAHSKLLTDELCKKLGSDLGSFLAAVHRDGSRDEELMETCAGNVQGKQISVWATYGRLLESVAGTGDCANLFQTPLDASEEQLKVVAEVAKVRSSEILAAKDVFTMGDFWTGNMVLNTQLDKNETPKVFQAYVVDWELAKPSLPFMDVGQFAAEMRLLQKFFPETKAYASSCLDSFFESYQASLSSQPSANFQVDETFIRGVAIHLGVHLIVWTPRIDTWKPAATVREVALEGLDMIVRAWGTEDAWLRSSIVGKLFSQAP